jgi:hypothetical protein
MKMSERKPGVVVHICNPAFRRLRQKDHKFKTIRSYIVRICVKKEKSGAWVAPNPNNVGHS